MKIMTVFPRLWYVGLGLLIFVTACQQENSSTSTPSVETTSKYPEINQLNQKITEQPENADLYFTRAQAYAQLEGYDEAIADLAKAMSIDSTNLAYHHLLADVYLNYAQSYRAILTLQRARGLYPEDVPTQIKLIKFHIILKQYPEALAMIQEVLQKDPQNAEAYFMMGLTFREQDKVNNAINAFQTAVENDPDLIDAWIILGKLYQSKDNPVAIQYFDNAVRLDSSNISAHHTRANYLQQAGQLEKAIAAYRKITLLDPDYSDAYFNTGLAYLEMDSVALALRHFDLVVKTDPTNAQGYYFRGVCAERSGEFQKAKQDFQQTLSFDPEFEEARAALNKVDQQLQSGS